MHEAHHRRADEQLLPVSNRQRAAVVLLRSHMFSNGRGYASQEVLPAIASLCVLCSSFVLLSYPIVCCL